MAKLDPIQWQNPRDCLANAYVNAYGIAAHDLSLILLLLPSLLRDYWSITVRR